MTDNGITHVAEVKMFKNIMLIFYDIVYFYAYVLVARGRLKT